MIKNTHLAIVSLLLAIGIILLIGVPKAVAATGDASKEQACAAIGGNPNAVGECTTGGTDVNKIIKVIINLISSVVGVIAVIMIIVSGFKYITSGGDASKVTAAKNSITYALIGLVIVALAQVIVRFVLAKTTT